MVRKRLKFSEDYLYLSRNTVMDRHSNNIYKKLLEYFKPEDIHKYPNLWETYEILSKYLNISEDKLLITRGVEGAIKQVFDNLILEGDTIGITSPGYAMYNVYADIGNVNVISIKGDYPDCNITVNQIKEIVPKIKILFLDNPKSHIPSCFTHSELFEIINYCKVYNVIVFLDEVYVDWEVKSYLPNLDKHDNLIIARSFSKIAFPSIKSGWLVTNKELKTKLELTRSSYELDYFSCKSIEFLIDNENYIDSIKEKLIRTKKRWYKELSKNNNIQVYDSKNYVLRLYSKDTKLIKSMYEDLYKKKIVVGLVDKFNLIFSVVNDKKVEKEIFDVVKQ
tara:strand:- start:18 stop:1025 length:1008 start_codon:yes stop_codon:yes gene_type:complete